MSCIYQCDRCGKVIDESKRMVSKGNGEYEIVAASRLRVIEGARHYDLCLECKTELYDWLHGAWLKEANKND